MTSVYPFLYYGAYKLYKNNKLSQIYFDPLLITSLIYVLTISKVPHKEPRFTVPIMPFLLTISAFGLYQIKTKNVFRLSLLKILLTIFVLFALGFNYARVMDFRTYSISDQLATLNHKESVAIL